MGKEAYDADRVSEALGIILDKLSELKDPEAKELYEKISGTSGKIEALTAKMVRKEKDESDERINRAKNFITRLVYIDGNPNNGLKESVDLSNKDLREMKELGIGFHYSGDAMFRRTVGGNRLHFSLPNGEKGSLYFHSDEKGFDYEFRKHAQRPHDIAA
jgi:hypothetical protein